MYRSWSGGSDNRKDREDNTLCHTLGLSWGWVVGCVDRKTWRTTTLTSTNTLRRQTNAQQVPTKLATTNPTRSERTNSHTASSATMSISQEEIASITFNARAELRRANRVARWVPWPHLNAAKDDASCVPSAGCRWVAVLRGVLGHIPTLWRMMCRGCRVRVVGWLRVRAAKRARVLLGGCEHGSETRAAGGVCVGRDAPCIPLAPCQDQQLASIVLQQQFTCRVSAPVCPPAPRFVGEAWRQCRAQPQVCGAVAAL